LRFEDDLEVVIDAAGAVVLEGSAKEMRDMGGWSGVEGG
jgi:hypothetical protein